MTLIGTSFETTSDAIAIGCLLALSGEELIEKTWYKRAVASRWVAPLLLLLGLALSYRYRPGLLVGTTVLNVAIAIGVDRCVRRPQGSFGRLLNTPFLVYIGGLSYSLYLWQQLFLNRNSSAWPSVFPLSVALAVLCALASYYLVERPALRVRPRVEAWFDRRRAAAGLGAGIGLRWGAARNQGL